MNDEDLFHVTSDSKVIMIQHRGETCFWISADDAEITIRLGSKSVTVPRICRPEILVEEVDTRLFTFPMISLEQAVSESYAMIANSVCA